MNHKVEWIILVTDNYQKSHAFYKDTLGLEIEREVPNEEFCQYKMQNCYLALYGRKFMNNLVGEGFIKSSGGAIYTFGESENIDGQYEGLKSKGVKFIKSPTTQAWGQRTAYFTDPDGHIWEIQQWISNKDS